MQALTILVIACVFPFFLSGQIRISVDKDSTEKRFEILSS